MTKTHTEMPVLEKKKILIVDDEWSLQEFLKWKLADSGYDIAVAQNGTEFHQQAREIKPDLIILDILLPDGLGTDHYEALLRSGFDRNIPVIFLSALAQEQPPKLSPKEGRFALFGKPFDYQELMSEIKKLLDPPLEKTG
jgi:DNA-binding response OmpR family regulator